MTRSIKHREKRNTKSKEHKQQFIDMPLDVLIEIFLFLEPLDLLHLARTTKGLRAFLLNRRKSSALWKNAISNFKDFPPCPDHMSPPAYTHLAFVPVCHGCFCPCETIEWELRMRCCPNCFPKMTTSQISCSCGNHFNELPMARRHYKLNDDYGLRITVSFGPIRHMPTYSPLDWKVVESNKRLKRVGPKKEFLAQQKDLWGSIRGHAHSCREWEYVRLQEKAAQLSRVRRQRVQDIISRLEELGWIWTGSSHHLNTLCQMPNYYGKDILQLPEVRRLEPLTPAEWTTIYPQLISWLQRTKEESVIRYRMKTYEPEAFNIRQDLSNDASLKVQPLMIDIAMMPAVRSVIESNIDFDMDCDDLKKKFVRVLPPAIRKWSSNAVEELEQFAREELGLPPLSKPSCLPSVIFRCKACRRRLRFDEALSHQHLYKERRGECKGTREMSIYDEFLMEMYDVHPRNVRVLRVDVTVSRRVENLVRRMGQNPSRVTYRELLPSTVQVACGLCRPGVVARMSFARAFEHCLESHLGKKETEVWTRVSARE